MSAELRIRQATPFDLAFLVECSTAMAFETESKTLDRAVLTHGIEAVFADPRRGFYLLAERAGASIGCLLITYEWSDWRNGDWWWIQSVYVISAARRSGVFRALYSEVEQCARASPGVVGLRLYVEEGNAPARATYASLGMNDPGYRLLQSGFIDFGEPRPPHP